MTQLTCKNLNLGYNSHIVVKDLNFSVNKGDYLCIIGDNGAGKTTLVKSILGLLKPISGEITWSDNLSFNEIGYLTQQSEIQKDFPASVKEIVMSGFQSKKFIRLFYTKSEKEKAFEIMKKMQVEQFANTCYRELSGGQQQRVLLARALCSTEKILFLDEPVTGLDPQLSHEMYSLVEKLNKDGVTVVMISHDVEHCLKYASHILKIGNNPFYGTTSEYKEKGDFANGNN